MKTLAEQAASGQVVFGPVAFGPVAFGQAVPGRSGPGWKASGPVVGWLAFACEVSEREVNSFGLWRTEADERSVLVTDEQLARALAGWGIVVAVVVGRVGEDQLNSNREETPMDVLNALGERRNRHISRS